MPATWLVELPPQLAMLPDKACACITTSKDSETAIARVLIVLNICFSPVEKW
jgi:hypothetical protein